MTTTLLQQAHDLLLPVYGETSNICTNIRAHLAAQPPATSADYAMGYAEGFNDACKPAPPAPAKPVAYAQNPKDGFWFWCLADEPGAIPLYTHPAAQPAPVPVPLTDEQIIAVRKAVPLFTSSVPWENSIAFARAIERANGIAASAEVP